VNVPRVNAPSLTEFVQMLETGAPAVITGSMSTWRALECWTPTYFSDRVPHRRVLAARTSGHGFSPDPTLGWLPSRFDTIAFDQLARDLAAGKLDHYLALCSIPESLPELLEDVVVPIYFAIGDTRHFHIKARREAIQLWMAAAASVSPLHYDSMWINLLCQVVGSKEYVLASPGQYGTLSANPAWSRNPTHSPLDLFEEPPTDARGLATVSLKPGEMLLIPNSWWHQARSNDFTITVSFWWTAPWRQALRLESLRLALQIFCGRQYSKRLTRLKQRTPISKGVVL